MNDTEGTSTMNQFNRGDRVKVVADKRDGYHYLPIGTHGIVEFDVRPADDTAQVRTTEPIVSTKGREHLAGLRQIVPLEDLEIVQHEEGTLGAYLHEAQIPGVPCPDHPAATS